MALCCWPCNCYAAHDAREPDLMWDLDLYARLDLADAWAVIGPVNWYAPSSNLKLLFDRLVCMSGGNPREDLIGHKDPERARALEHSRAWPGLSLNHLEGRSAAFFCYGDGGADEVDPSGRPRALRHPAYFDPDREPFRDGRDAYAPLVWQCRYSGIEVPDGLWRYVQFGRGRKYADNQAEHLAADDAVLADFDGWRARFVAHVADKGVRLSRALAPLVRRPAEVARSADALRHSAARLVAARPAAAGAQSRRDPPPRGRRAREAAQMSAQARGYELRGKRIWVAGHRGMVEQGFREAYDWCVANAAPGREARRLLPISRERPEEAETPIRQD
jgi:hypothetical protein